MEWLASWDLQIMETINVDWSTPILDTFFVAIASFHLWKVPLIMAAVVAVIWGGFRWRVFVALALLCVLVGDTGVSSTLKSIIDRPRPHENEDGLRKVRLDGWKVVAEPSQPRPVQHGNSMPSSHTCNNVAIAMVASCVFRPWGTLMWLWAILIGYSRIYTGDHYPADVLVSFPIAIFYSGLMVFLCIKLWTSLAPKYVATIYERHPHLI